MVLFGFILFVSVAALLAAQAMDIECENPPTRRQSRILARKTRGFPEERMGLRQI